MYWIIGYWVLATGIMFWSLYECKKADSVEKFRYHSLQTTIWCATQLLFIGMLQILKAIEKLGVVG